ncbi:MAG: type VI secretion system contractile sheath large subunit [Candidatus Rokubacteria bacterium]|nr:type VI secretion system contractile sheath large subunit [Candidatus Rokubacteria bacterium]
MRILLMSDLSGRGHRGVHDAGPARADRSVVAVDVDSFDKVFARLAPALRLPLRDAGAPETVVEFHRLEDFHPDELYQRLDLFQTYRGMRRRVLDPVTFGEAAAELRRERAGQPEAIAHTGAGASRPPGQAFREDDRAMLERLLGKSAAAGGPQRVDISRFLRRIVEPYIAPEKDPQQDELVMLVDEATSAQMRQVMHHPAFQALEAAWRSVHRLVTSLEIGEDLKLYLLDLSRQELEADVLAAGRDLEQSALFRVLVKEGSRAAGDQPWSLLVGDYSFGADAKDASLLAALGAIASQTGGPFLAAADHYVLGCRSLAESPDPRDWKPGDFGAARAWEALRRGSVASWIGLALPRVLLRLPYGRRTDAAEQFGFEEMPQSPDHEAYLWGNPAFACALLLARSFLERGWAMQPGDLLEIGDLPAHTYEEGGERRMTPCAEVFLTERAADAILSQGVMPLLSRRDSNAARLLRFQSVADPPAALSGPWA